MATKRPNPTFMSWLGRQVGHVRKAIKPKPNQPASKTPRPAPTPAGGRAKPPVVEVPAPAEQATVAKVIYREDKIEEAELPDQPGVVFRRTVIDEIVIRDESPDRPETP